MALTHGEVVGMLVHDHFQPAGIAQARTRIEAKIAAGEKAHRHEDYKRRLAEYDQTLTDIETFRANASSEAREQAAAEIAIRTAHMAQGVA